MRNSRTWWATLGAAVAGAAINGGVSAWFYDVDALSVAGLQRLAIGAIAAAATTAGALLVPPPRKPADSAIPYSRGMDRSK